MPSDHDRIWVRDRFYRKSDAGSEKKARSNRKDTLRPRTHLRSFGVAAGRLARCARGGGKLPGRDPDRP